MPENAIERRVGILTDRWLDFVDEPDQRVLRWWGDADEMRMVNAFLAYQTSVARDIPDLFLRPETSFRSAESFGAAVFEELVTGYRDGREALEGDGIPVAWEPPPLKEGGSAVDLLRCLLSLQHYYSDLAERVVLVLDSPVAVLQGEWLRWFGEALAAEVPPQVRFLVLEHESAPLLAPLTEEPRGGSMKSAPLALDMPAAYRELAQAGDRDDPGVAFRIEFVELSQAIERKDPTAARAAARRALAIAEPRGWWGPVVAVQIALAGALEGFGEPDDALALYGNAVRTSQAAVDQGSPEGAGLLVRSRLAYGGALFGRERYEMAARFLEETAQRDEAAEDPILRIEAWRVASHAHELAGQGDRAWECGWWGLKVGEDLDEDLRKGSTLPYLGLRLLELCRRAGAEDTAAEVRTRLEALLGPGWRPADPRAGS